jgi:hypothetical protein
MTEENILGGFRGAALVPLSSESVIAKFGVNLRTPTPVREVDELPALGGPGCERTRLRRLYSWT